MLVSNKFGSIIKSLKAQRNMSSIKCDMYTISMNAGEVFVSFRLSSNTRKMASLLINSFMVVMKFNADDFSDNV